MAIRVGINGFGRIGRVFFRAVVDDPEIEVVGINDLGTIESLAYLLQYDSVYGHAHFPIETEGEALIVNGKRISVTHEAEPAKIPWGAYDTKVVVESTGVFTDPEKAKGHMLAGASCVVISAPLKGDPSTWLGAGGAETILMGVNEEKFAVCDISSNASCTTNAASPLIGILSEAIGIERAVLSTVHGYTASQSLVDAPNKKDLREGRAAGLNIVPSSTGAAIATTLAHTTLKNKFDGIAFRVPVPAGSIVDVTFVASRPTTVEEVNAALTNAAKDERWSGVFGVTNEPLVSSDILGTLYGSIADLSLTRVVDGTLVKVLGWYDNEMGYAHTLALHVKKAAAAH